MTRGLRGSSDRACISGRFYGAIAKQKSYLFLIENAGVRCAQAILRLLNIGFFGAISMMFDL
jgi:hypothetical protein